MDEGGTEHFHRIFKCSSLTLQDPDGAYIARWVLELAQLPRKWLHQPWLAPPDILDAAGVKFGAEPGCYPSRITTTVPQVAAKHPSSNFPCSASVISAGVLAAVFVLARLLYKCSKYSARLLLWYVSGHALCGLLNPLERFLLVALVHCAL